MRKRPIVLYDLDRGASETCTLSYLMATAFVPALPAHSHPLSMEIFP